MVDQFQPNAEAAGEFRAKIVAKAAPAEGAGAADAQKATGWGTIQGTIVVVGAPPKPGVVLINKDLEVCQPGGHPVVNDNLVINPSGGGLANVAIFAQGLKGENVHESAVAKKGSEVSFDQKTCLFLTHVATIQVGQKLKIINSDPISHNTLIRGNPEFNQTLSPGQAVMYEPAKPMTAPAGVACSIHPWMSAYLLPRDNGYVAVTNPEGKFEIKNLPAGINLKLQLWHEALKEYGGVEINGQKQPLSRGVLPIKIEPDKTTTLEIKIPASAFPAS
ncbi:MAG: hypothetical protein K8T25_12030 [Planctomycetia bacterium]|nr:hypothetical protein [Planctomycetia bacterium]